MAGIAPMKKTPIPKTIMYVGGRIAKNAL